MTSRSDRSSRPVLARYAQLLVGCVVIGVGVALMLEAALGSDGYSTLVNGLTLASGLQFWQLNMVVGAVFVGLAWARGTRPGPGTLVQWFFVGFVISGVMAAIPDVVSMPLRIAMLVVALVLIAVGVAVVPGQRAPAPGRRRRWRSPGTRRSRSAGATTSSSSAERWSGGCSAPPWGRARSWSSCCSVRPSTSSAAPSRPWSGRPCPPCADPGRPDVVGRDQGP